MKRVAGVRVEERGRGRGSRVLDRRDELLDAERDDQRDHDQPDAAAEAAAARTPRGAEPQRLAAPPTSAASAARGATRITTSTNCQTSPAVRRDDQRLRDTGSGRRYGRRATGATTQASRPIGSAAAAQTPRIFAEPQYCGIASAAEAAASARAWRWSGWWSCVMILCGRCVLDARSAARTRVVGKPDRAPPTTISDSDFGRRRQPESVRYVRRVTRLRSFARGYGFDAADRARGARGRARGRAARATRRARRRLAAVVRGAGGRALVLPLLAPPPVSVRGARGGVAAGGRDLVRRRPAGRVHRPALDARRAGGGVPARATSRRALQARLGLAIVVGGAAIVVSNDPSHAPGDFVFIPLVFALAWLAGFALRERAAAGRGGGGARGPRRARARGGRARRGRRGARPDRARAARHRRPRRQRDGAPGRRRPPQAARCRRRTREALRGVEQTGRTALAEMRRLLGAMRRRRRGRRARAPARPRQPRRAAGRVRPRGPARATCTSTASRSPLPRGLDLSAYRIVQEGLTNALKHAHASHADVRVRYAPDELPIDVRDDGDGSAPRATASATASSACASA